LARLAELGLFRFIHPKLTWSDKLNRLLQGVEEAADWYKLLYLDRPMEPWLPYMMALMQVLPEQAVSDTLKRFPFSDAETERIKAGRFDAPAVMRQLHRRPPPRPAETYRLLADWADEPVVYLMGMSKSDSVKRQVSAFLTTYRQMKPAVTGADLKAMGLKAGPQYRRILAQLLEARLNGDITNSGEERRMAERLVKQSRLG
jgi:tRNA nucleotidyltransferase (CCA-adding enzyme)